MSSLIRVLQVVTIMNRNGLETMLMNYYRHIDRSQVQFDFIVHRSERGAYDDEIESLGGKIYRMPPIHPKYLFSYLNQLNIFFKEHKEYRIVHSHLDVLSTFVLRAAKKYGVPVRISHSHNTSFSDKGLRRLFKLYSKSCLNRQCTHYFACSEVAGRFQFGDEIVDSGRLTVLKNAIDTAKFRFDEAIRNKIRVSLGLKDEFVVGHVGRFCEQKNHDFLIDIFNEVHKRKPNSLLLLIGDGPLRSSIELKAEKLRLSSCVRFLGVKENVNEYMMAIDVFVLPSLYEGLGIVAVEAQAAGLPVVVSSAVPTDVKLTNNVSFIGLKEVASVWAKRVLSGSLIARDYSANNIVKLSYDIEANAEWLQYFYRNNWQ